jgi:hypothetical protein
MVEDRDYTERLSSARTEALFIGLTALFAGFTLWRSAEFGFDGLAVVLLCAAAFFLFYSVNYRILITTITRQEIRLTFGVFTWRIPLHDVDDISPDDVSLWRIGGAGIHFTWVRRRYRAMFNFLEHPRVVVQLRRKKGPVRDVVFSTARPGEVMRIVKAKTWTVNEAGA